MGTHPIRDFRSDTVTVAGPAMREAMAAAPVGDDVYDEDPTVNRLQDRVAELAGKEAALFLTSGTQSNLSAVLSHCGRGDEFIIGRDYHILLNEAAGAAALGGASPWPIDCDADGAISPDDVSLCLSKGLGAPVGTVLAGDRATIARAHRARKILGGGLRQAGHLAAAGLYALDHHVDRLADDHARADRLANGLRPIGALSLEQGSNMVWVTPPAEHHDDLVAHLEANGLLAIFWKPTMRFVTHHDIDDADVDELVDAFDRFFDAR